MNKLGCLIGMFITCGVCEAQGQVIQMSLPQLQAGVYVHDTIFWAVEGGIGGSCGQYAQFNVCVNSNLIPVVTGVNFEWLIISMTQPAATVYTNQTGIVHVNDSLIYTSTNNCFNFHFNAPGSMIAAFVIAGTPSIAFENYPCIMIDTAFIILNGSCDLVFDNLYPSQTICSVSNFNAVSEQIFDSEINIFPNPFSDRINITIKRNELVEISLFDVTSRKIFNQSFINSTSINTEQLAKGIYLYEMRNTHGVIKKGKVVKD